MPIVNPHPGKHIVFQENRNVSRYFMIVGYLPDFGSRWAKTYLGEKKNCQNSICSLSPGDHEYGRLILQFVTIQKLLAENWLNKLACTDHMYRYVRHVVSAIEKSDSDQLFSRKTP